MQADAIAQTYARSLFELAGDAGGQAKIEEINDEIEQIIELVRQMPRFGNLLSSPIVDQKGRGEALRRAFNGRVTDLMLRFLLVLNAKGRLDKLGAIAEAFDHLVQESFGRIEVDVFTAAPLGPEASEAIRRRISNALGREPVLHPYIDANMIGGVKLRIGDQLVDGSVQTRLRKMRGDLLRSGGWSIRERLERYFDDSTGPST